MFNHFPHLWPLHSWPECDWLRDFAYSLSFFHSQLSRLVLAASHLFHFALVFFCSFWLWVKHRASLFQSIPKSAETGRIFYKNGAQYAGWSLVFDSNVARSSSELPNWGAAAQHDTVLWALRFLFQLLFKWCYGVFKVVSRMFFWLDNKFLVTSSDELFIVYSSLKKRDRIKQTNRSTHKKNVPIDLSYCQPWSKQSENNWQCNFWRSPKLWSFKEPE